jgi:signal transduction histidine kinase
MHIHEENAPRGAGSLLIHDHPCSVYENADELKAQFVPYLQSGLLLGERCVYFVDENTPEFVILAMQENGFHLKSYIDNGAFKIIWTSDAHLHEGYFSEDKMMRYWNQSLEEAQSAGFGAMRAAVEMTWALSEKPGCEILAPYEARLNAFTDSSNVSVLCAYHRRKFSAEKIKAVIHAHPILISGDRVLDNPTVISPDRFIEGDAHLDVQATIDNLEMIAELSRANALLQAQERRSRELYQELQDLARTVSHEMQEPLGLIVTYVGLLAARYSGRLGKDADEFISRSTSAANTVSRMIDDLWTYARIDGTQSQESDVDSLQVLEEILEENKSLFKQRHTEITYGNLPILPMKRIVLKYIFRELIENATKHDGAKPHIHISAESIGDGWKFAVKDDGPGIDAAHSVNIFKIFNRLGKRPDETGSGMGLAIVKRMVENQAGQIWFESQPAGGTTFYFTVRQRKPAAQTRAEVPDMLTFAAYKRSTQQETRESL